MKTLCRGTGDFGSSWLILYWGDQTPVETDTKPAQDDNPSLKKNVPELEYYLDIWRKCAHDYKMDNKYINGVYTKEDTRVLFLA